jgi:hypothetical protein
MAPSLPPVIDPLGLAQLKIPPVAAIAQALAAVGSPDLRLNSFSQIDVRLLSLWRSWKRVDPNPTRVKAIPVQVLHQLVDITRHLRNPMLLAVSDMVILAFFFLLLRPGEYTSNSSNTTPFTLRDIQPFINASHF